MITNKYITRIVVILITVATVFCLCAMAFSDQLETVAGGVGVAMQYEAKLFDTAEIMEVNIEIDEEDWQELLDNAISETYYRCDVEINGTKVNNVGIRPKGNTSLTSIAADPDTDRYSLKLEFDQYVEGQTCFGLDKLILNNNYADATNMKEAIVYDMYQYLGADASLYNYAKVSINGEYWGIYLALEAVEDSFLMRNYGTENGELYKPESMGMGGRAGNEKEGEASSFGGGAPGGQAAPPAMPEGDFSGSSGESGTALTKTENASEGASDGDSQMPGGEVQMPGGNSQMPGGNVQMPEGGVQTPGGNVQMPEGESQMPGGEVQTPGGDFQMPEGGFQMPGGDFQMPEGGFQMPGGFSMSGGADLNYTDDNLESYETIWEGEVTKTKDKDHEKVVTALKNISEGTELETYLDVDNVLKYMAVHTFVVNQDSLTGNMAHNYYLYESGGRLNILPWDYNLAFGGMGMGGSGGSDVVNHPIDTPFSGTQFFDTLLQDETYLAQYHEYLRQLAEVYVSGGRFDETYQRIREQINSLVETDPTAFYSFEEYEKGADMLYDTVVLRAESIKGQLEGTVPATSAGQRENASALIDASSIDVEVMGTMNMGGMGGGPSGFGRETEAADNGQPAEAQPAATQAMQVREKIEEPETMPAQDGTEEPETISTQDGTEEPETMSTQEETEEPETEEAIPEGETAPEPGTEAESERTRRERPEGFNPSGFGAGGSGSTSGTAQAETLILYAVCLVVMLCGILFAAFYRRR